MRGLKVLVAVMTLLLALGMGLLVYGLVAKTGPKAQTAASQRPTAPLPDDVAPLPAPAETAGTPLPPAADTHELELPPLSAVEHVSAWKDGVALYVATPGGDYIYFVDPASGVQPMRVKIKRGRGDAAPAPASATPATATPANPGGIPLAQ